MLSARDAPADNAWPTADLVARALAARPPAWCVAELTSNHLAVCSASPHIACITNVWPDHVDQHGSLAAYLEAKRRIVAFQSADDWAVVNADDPGRVELAAGAAARVLPRDARRRRRGSGRGRRGGPSHGCGWTARRTTSGPSPPCRRRRVPRTACWPPRARCSRAPRPTAIARALAGWRGLPLRREHLGIVAGAEVIRDALAATPAKAAAGLALHPPGSVVLIAGGNDDLGGGPMHASPGERALFERAAAVAARACAHAALFGPAAPRLAAALTAAGLASVSRARDARRGRRRRARPRRARPHDPLRPVVPDHARGARRLPGSARAVMASNRISS